jgi:hypothetical protein
MFSLFVCLSVLFFPLPGVCRIATIGEAKKIFFSIGPKPSPHYHTTPRGVEKKTGPKYATSISAQLVQGEGDFRKRRQNPSNQALVRTLGTLVRRKIFRAFYSTLGEMNKGRQISDEAAVSRGRR